MCVAIVWRFGDTLQTMVWCIGRGSLSPADLVDPSSAASPSVSPRRVRVGPCRALARAAAKWVANATHELVWAAAEPHTGLHASPYPVHAAAALRFSALWQAWARTAPVSAKQPPPRGGSTQGATPQ